MNDTAVRELVDALLAVSPEAADRDELGRATALNAKLARFSAHYAVRCTRRANQLNAEGRSEDGFALLVNETGSPRDAKATGERDRVCTELPQFDTALANGDISTEHLDALARHTKDLTDEQRDAVREPRRRTRRIRHRQDRLAVRPRRQEPDRRHQGTDPAQQRRRRTRTPTATVHHEALDRDRHRPQVHARQARPRPRLAAPPTGRCPSPRPAQRPGQQQPILRATPHESPGRMRHHQPCRRRRRTHLRRRHV